MPTFSGFSPAATEFYAALEDDNSKAFWQTHKPVYESEVRDPMLALLDALSDEFGDGKAFRPYRDTRFSKDKSPYKTQQGALAGTDPGIGYYVAIDADGLLAGGGFHAHTTVQVERFRTAVDDDTTGPELEAIVASLRSEGFAIEGSRLKTRPRGYAADHPRIDLLRYKELMAFVAYGRPAWLATPQALDEVRGAWRAVRPLSDWITTHVGAA